MEDGIDGMSTAEYLHLEAEKLRWATGTSDEQLTVRQEELLRRIEFVLMMQQMWRADEPI